MYSLQDAIVKVIKGEYQLVIKRDGQTNTMIERIYFEQKPRY